MPDISNSKLRKIDGTLLLVFAEAYRLRKLTAVSQRLGMTQSAVSHAIGRLREIFEDELFLRRPFGVEPTQRARELASRIDAIVRLTREALTEGDAFEPASSSREFRVTGLDSAIVFARLTVDRAMPAVGPQCAAHVPFNGAKGSAAGAW
jgi:DNA-binding transcriptional LysR family regulator